MSSTIVVSEQFDSMLEFTGDVDTYDIFLTGLKTFDFQVKGKTVNGETCYPKLLVYDGNRTPMASNDGDGINPDVQVAFLATSGGWYCVEVAGHNGSSGYYTLTSALVA